MEGTDLKWFARKGYGPNTIYTGPDYDHTYGNSQGYYAIISITYLKLFQVTYNKLF